MDNENKKEILTRDIVKKELKKVYSYNLIILLLCFAFLLFAVLFLMFAQINDDGGFVEYMKTLSSTQVMIIKVSTFIFALILINFFVYFLCGICKFFKVLHCINKNKFDLISDKLTDSKKIISTIRLTQVLKEEVNDWRKWPHICVFPKIEAQLLRKNYLYKLCFEKHKEYFLPLGKLYSWSQVNNMNDWQVFRSTEIGDEFYTVVINNKIIYVYNNKFFELKD